MSFACEILEGINQEKMTNLSLRIIYLVELMDMSIDSEYISPFIRYRRANPNPSLYESGRFHHEELR